MDALSWIVGSIVVALAIAGVRASLHRRAERRRLKAWHARKADQIRRETQTELERMAARPAVVTRGRQLRTESGYAEGTRLVADLRRDRAT